MEQLQLPSFGLNCVLEQQDKCLIIVRKWVPLNRALLIIWKAYKICEGNIFAWKQCGWTVHNIMKGVWRKWIEIHYSLMEPRDFKTSRWFETNRKFSQYLGKLWKSLLHYVDDARSWIKKRCQNLKETPTNKTTLDRFLKEMPPLILEIP